MGRKRKEVNLDDISSKGLMSSRHYVNNNELREELIRCKASGELTEKAILMFQQIAKRLSTKLKYTNPMDREDCISQAVLDCIMY